MRPYGYRSGPHFRAAFDSRRRDRRAFRARQWCRGVNKVSTAVELRFDLAGSPSLPEPLRARLLARRDRRVTGEGVLVIDAQRFRTQDRNREDARERLAEFIRAGLSVPKPRKATRPTYGSTLRRLDAKRGRAQVKRGRSTRNWE